MPRISYIDTPLHQRISRQADGDAIMAVLLETVQLASNEDRRSRSRKLITILGEAGIGKTWFFDYLQERIINEQQSWRIHKTYQAEDVVRTSINPYFLFLELLKACDRALGIGCLPDLPDSGNVTVETVAEWTATLEERLIHLKNRPLLIFFDELEWWVGLKDESETVLTHFFRIVWSMLLRQSQLPVIILCAGRRIPPLKHPLLRLVQHPYELKGFPAGELQKLVPQAERARLRPLIKLYSEDSPWATQLLQEILTANPDLVNQKVIPENTLRQLFDNIVGDRFVLDPELKDVLFAVASQRQDGFTAKDNLLPQGDTTLSKLMNSSFIDFDRQTKRYFVVPVLARWFNRGDANDA